MAATATQLLTKRIESEHSNLIEFETVAAILGLEVNQFTDDRIRRLFAAGVDAGRRSAAKEILLGFRRAGL
jgi:hypothetical protein